VHTSRSLLLVCLASLFFTACGDPPDDTPAGREFAAIMAKPEQQVDAVKVSHVLLAFVGAKKGSESGHTFEEARELAMDVLKRARKGEDFAALMKQYSGDDGGGTYNVTQANRGDWSRRFADVALRLAVGEAGLATYHRSKCEFGFHVIKRLQ
jgi:parvulin-like peptidyl-prolyl isomerase